MKFSNFKDIVINLRKKVEDFKINHKMASEAISEFLDSDLLPWPFKPFCKVFWEGLEKNDKSAEEMLQLLEKIEKDNEQSFVKIECMISKLINEQVKNEDMQKIAHEIMTTNKSIIQILETKVNEIEENVRKTLAISADVSRRVEEILKEEEKINHLYIDLKVLDNEKKMNLFISAAALNIHYGSSGSGYVPFVPFKGYNKVISSNESLFIVGPHYSGKSRIL